MAIPLQLATQIQKEEEEQINKKGNKSIDQEKHSCVDTACDKCE